MKFNTGYKFEKEEGLPGEELILEVHLKRYIISDGLIGDVYEGTGLFQFYIAGACPFFHDQHLFPRGSFQASDFTGFFQVLCELDSIQ